MPAGFAITGVSGSASTVALGDETVTCDANIYPTNVVGTTGLGSVATVSINIIPITLGAATGTLNSVTTTSDANIYPTNVLATGIIF